jgi:hypothetical protein
LARGRSGRKAAGTTNGYFDLSHLLHNRLTDNLVTPIEQLASRGSEANTVIHNFNMLRVSDQQALQNYLRPLWVRRPMMRRALYACALLGLLAWQYGAALSLRVTTSFPSNPEDGRVADGSYTSDYFSLAYLLPQGWIAGEAGPDPSASGYYVLAQLLPQSELTGTILMAAQDKFFGTNTHATASDIARDFRRAMSNIDGMTIDRELTEMKVADHVLYRVDYSGVGLYRAAISTESRCHIVSFNVTTRDPTLLATLVHSLDSLSFAARGHGGSSPPPCVQDYAVGDNVLHKVTPVSVGPKFTPIPVRIIVGTDGSVKHVHVIRATTEQRRSIEEALYQWKLKPYEINGRFVPVETGLIFKFTGGSTAQSP